MNLQMDVIRSNGLVVDQYSVYGDSHGDYYGRLKSWLVSKEIPVMEDPWLEEESGALGATWCLGPQVCVIAIDSDEPKNTQFNTLLHEAVHAIYLPDNPAHREILAETVALEAAFQLGLDTRRESMSYLLNFEERDRNKVWRDYEKLIVELTAALVKASKGEG